MFNNTTITIDLAKHVFQIALFNQAGKEKLNTAVSAEKMIRIINQYPKAKIYMEACSSAHFWGRKFQTMGYFVELLPAQIVANYRNGNKNDKNDALAIFEASKNERIHPVAIKTLEQQDIALLHTHREGFKKSRNQIANRIRGFAAEYGVYFSVGINKLFRQVPEALENAENGLTPIIRSVLKTLLDELNHVTLSFDKLTKEIEAISKSNHVCQRLLKIPGIGAIGSSILYAKFGQGDGFKKGRDASASLGLVPGHSGTGGKVRNTGITKRGDVYIRSILANGARCIVMNAKKKKDALSLWICQLLERKSYNTTVIAVANKLVRIAFAVLKSGKEYQPAVAQ